jgi:hypothetical protein
MKAFAFASLVLLCGFVYHPAAMTPLPTPSILGCGACAKEKAYCLMNMTSPCYMGYAQFLMSINKTKPLTAAQRIGAVGLLSGWNNQPGEVFADPKVMALFGCYTTNQAACASNDKCPECASQTMDCIYGDSPVCKGFLLVLGEAIGIGAYGYATCTTTACSYYKYYKCGMTKCLKDLSMEATKYRYLPGVPAKCEMGIKLCVGDPGCKAAFMDFNMKTMMGMNLTHLHNLAMQPAFVLWY